MDKELLIPSAVPCLFDADLSLLDRSRLQSGIGFGSDLRLEEIVSPAPLHWAPRVLPGSYFIGAEEHYLYSDGAVRLVPREVGTTVLNLPFLPLEGEPLSVVTYFRDVDGRIAVGRRWRQKVRFTGTMAEKDGQRLEQVDLDQEGGVINYNLAYADPTRPEFVLRRYPDCTARVEIAAALRRDGGRVGQVVLDPPAVTDLPLLFTNQVLFGKRVDAYPANPGEWQLSSHGAILNVFLPAGPVDPGFLTYYHRYPADLLFARSYVLQHGELTDPQTLEATEILGVSDGSAYLCFPCRYFPLLGHSAARVFVEDPDHRTAEWTIVTDLSAYGPQDEVCAVDLDLGLVRFGDGTKGRIPPAGSRIGIVYASVPLVQYETRPNQTVTGREVNLHPLLTSVHRGFIYLGPQREALQGLTLVCDKPEISPGLYGPVYCGNDYAVLTCLAANPKGEPLTNLPVEFVVGEYGYFDLLPARANLRQNTQEDGKARTVFHPPGNIIRLAEVVELFDEDGNPLNPYGSITNMNDALAVSGGDFAGADHLNEALTFLLLDDDPLLPYDPHRRRGGSLVLLYHLDQGTGDFTPTRPIQLTADNYLQYPYSLPTPQNLSQLRKFVVALPKTVSVYCRATDPLSGREIRSNTVTLLIKAPLYQVGPYTVKRLGEQTPGSAVGAATYLTIGRRGELNAYFGVEVPQEGPVPLYVYPVPGYLGDGFNRDRFYSLQVLLAPDQSFIITHEWDYIHQGIWFQKISTATNQLISARFLRWPDACQSDGICADEDDGCSGSYFDYFGWHHPACVDERGKVYAASCDGTGRVYRLNSDTWQWEARSPIRPGDNYAEKHPGWDPDRSEVEMKLSRVSANPQYPYLWINTASAEQGSLGPMRVYLINRDTMANPYDSDDWAFAIGPPEGMIDDGTMQSEGYAKPGAFCLDDSTGRCYIMWTDAYSTPRQWFLSRFDPTNQEYVAVDISSVAGLNWTGAWAHMGYDPASKTLVFFYNDYDSSSRTFTAHFLFFNRDLEFIKEATVADELVPGNYGEDNFIRPFNSKFYVSNYYGGRETGDWQYVRLYEVDCAARTVKEVGRLPYEGEEGYLNLVNIACCPSKQSWYCEVEYYDPRDTILREVRLTPKPSGCRGFLSPVPAAVHPDADDGYVIGAFYDAGAVLAPDEEHLYLNCAWWPDGPAGDPAIRWFKVDLAARRVVATRDYYADDFPNCAASINYPFIEYLGFDLDEAGNIYSVLCRGLGKVCRFSPADFSIQALGPAENPDGREMDRIHAIRNAAFPYLWVYNHDHGQYAGIWLLRRDTLARPGNDQQYGLKFGPPGDEPDALLVSAAPNHMDGSLWVLWVGRFGGNRWISRLFPNGTRLDFNVSTLLPNLYPSNSYVLDHMAFDHFTEQLIVGATNNTLYFLGTIRPTYPYSTEISLKGTMADAYEHGYGYTWQRGVVDGYFYTHRMETDGTAKLYKIDVKTRTVVQSWDITTELDDPDNLAYIYAAIHSQARNSLLLLCRDEGVDLQELCLAG